MNRVYVAGVGVDNTTKEEALAVARECLNTQKQCKIFTPNPEMVVKAQKDQYFKDTLNSGDVNICDGRGLEWASKVKRLTGIDLMLALCGLAAKENKSVYLLGSGDDETVKLAAENLQKQFTGIKIAGYDKGPLLNDNATEENEDTVKKINQSPSDILFVAFGMGKQEKWIAANMAKMPGVKIAMGVGGSFDYISGKIPRAPLFLRRIGLEWLYRLYKQPARFGRIFNATVKFIFYALRTKRRGSANS